MKLRSVILLLLLAFLVVGLFGFITLKPIFNKDAAPEPTLPELDISANQTPVVTFVNPVLGNKNAPLTIVEYGDYLCSFCRTINSTLQKILSDYKENVRLVWKDFPLTNIHPLAGKLAEAGRCAGEEGRFWEYHDLAFAEQENILSEADVLRLGRELSLGADFETCYRTGKMQARIKADFNEGAGLGINGVPYFFVGGERLSGAISYERFRDVIAQQLKQ